MTISTGTEGGVEVVTEGECRTRSDRILAAINELEHRLFVSNGRRSLQDIGTDNAKAITDNAKAIKDMADKFSVPKSTVDKLWILALKSPWPVAASWIAFVYRDPLHDLLVNSVTKMFGP